MQNDRLVCDKYQVNEYKAEIFLYDPWRPKGFFQFEIIVNVLVVNLFRLNLNTYV